MYDHLSSRDDLLAAVVADVFPDWAGQVVGSMEATDTPGAQVWAYVEVNMRLFASSEQAVARALTSVVDPTLLAEPVSRFHECLQERLVAALEAHGEPQSQPQAAISFSALSDVALESPTPRDGAR